MHLYGFLIGIAIVASVFIFEKQNTLLSPKHLNYFIFGTILSGVIGARLYHVLDYWDYYTDNHLEIIKTWNGGLGIYGALLGGALFIYVFCQFKNISFIKLVNQVVIPLPLAQSIGRFGNLLNREVYSPSGQPVWLYESILNLLLFALILKVKKNKAAIYMISYGFIRFFLEFLREDTWAIANIKIAQIISLVFIVLGVIIKNHGQSRETII